MILQPRSQVIGVTGTENTYLSQQNIKEIQQKIKRQILVNDNNEKRVG